MKFRQKRTSFNTLQNGSYMGSIQNYLEKWLFSGSFGLRKKVSSFWLYRKGQFALSPQENLAALLITMLLYNCNIKRTL